MKKLLIFIVLFSAITTLSCSRVESGEVGIKFYLLGGDKGVDTEVLKPGKHFIGINQELYIFPTTLQNYVWTANSTESSPNDESFTFQTSEGLECSADVGITYHLEVVKVPVIFQKYKKGIEEITDVFMRNHVRDAFNNIASQYKVEKVYGAGKATLIKEIQEYVMSQLSPVGIIVDKIYWIGSVRLPTTVISALNAKVTATQDAEKRENELREAIAVAKKTVAAAEGKAKSDIALAKGKATANKLLNSSISTTLIKWEELQIKKALAEKWNGVSPTHILPESTLMGVK